MRNRSLALLASIFVTCSLFVLSESVSFAYDGNYRVYAVSSTSQYGTENIGSDRAHPLSVVHETESTRSSKENQMKDSLKILAFLRDGVKTEINFEDYLICVVMSEIPYTFEKEAIKAQAVAARTYALRQMNSGERHGFNTLCDDSSHCSAYLSKEEYTEKYGSDAYKKAYETVSEAVHETDGEVICYNGELCCAVYHSSSSGYTENSYNLWKTVTPYLTSVETYETVDSSEVTVKADKMGAFLSCCDGFNGDYNKISVEYNDSGRCDSVRIAGVTVAAGTLRSRFGLKSCDFSLKYSDGEYVFTVYGYGHGIGMSQLGADAMAKQGRDYREILLHYYSGVEICSIDY